MSLIVQIALLFLGSTLTIITAQVTASFTLHRENKKRIDEWMRKVDENHRLLQTLIAEHPLHTHTEKRGPLTYDGLRFPKVTV